MKLILCTDTHMFNKKVETKFETLIEEYTEILILIGMPLEKLPLNYDGLPFILQNIYDYIFEYGLYDDCLFDDVYSNNGRKENILKAYELVSGSGKNSKSINSVDVVDVATVLVLWLYYLPEVLISPKQFSMICDKNVNTNYQEIINSMNNITRQTLRQVMNIVNSYEKEHKSYKDKLRNLFTMLFTKHFDVPSKKNELQFIENLKTVLMKADQDNNEFMLKNKCSVIEENINQDENIFIKHDLCNKKNRLQSLSDDGLQHSVNNVDTIMKHNVLRKSSSCNPVRFISKEENFYNKVFVNSFTLNEDNLNLCSTDTILEKYSQDSSICLIDELICSSQIDDIRSVERTMLTHSRSSSQKRNKNKNIESHVEKVLKLGFLSNEDSMLLQNTLKLMKILSKIKSVQHQINMHRRNCEDELVCKNEDSDFSEFNVLNNRLEYLVNQKNNYQTKTGLSYGRSYNRTVQNLKNIQKEAFKLYQEEKNENKNTDKLLSNIYDIQIVLNYLKNNCGGKELPWRSSKDCPGYKRKTKKQLNCVTIMSDLQTIGEHEVMETISQSLFIPAERSRSL